MAEVREEEASAAGLRLDSVDLVSLREVNTFRCSSVIALVWRVDRSMLTFVLRVRAPCEYFQQFQVGDIFRRLGECLNIWFLEQLCKHKCLRR